MADEKIQDQDAMTSSDLQQSQSGGGRGQYGGNRDQQQSGQGTTGGQQMGGGASQDDNKQSGGSSGTGGYGDAQNQQFHQGQQDNRDGLADYGGQGIASGRSEEEQSRGERFDEEQGGGRG